MLLALVSVLGVSVRVVHMEVVVEMVHKSVWASVGFAPIEAVRAALVVLWWGGYGRRMKGFGMRVLSIALREKPLHVLRLTTSMTNPLIRTRIVGRGITILRPTLSSFSEDVEELVAYNPVFSEFFAQILNPLILGYQLYSFPPVIPALQGLNKIGAIKVPVYSRSRF